jgi:MFS family permease
MGVHCCLSAPLPVWVVTIKTTTWVFFLFLPGLGLRYSGSMSKSLIRDSRFSALFWTQFLGTFNEYLLKFTVGLAVTYRETLLVQGAAGLSLHAIAWAFLLPIFLFSPIAGQLADKFDKTRLIAWVKYCELFIVFVLLLGFVLGRLDVLLLSVFLMGVHAAFLGPCKSAYLPEHLNPQALVVANAWVEGTFFVAIALGAVTVGSLLGPNTNAVLVYALCGLAVVCSLLGMYTAKRMPATPPRQPELKFNWNVPLDAWRGLRFASQQARVWPAMLGVAWFWFFAASCLTQLPVLATVGLHASTGVANGLLWVFALGLLLGAWRAVRWSGLKAEVGLLPVGLMFMILGSMGLFCLLGQDLVLPTEQSLSMFALSPMNWMVLGCVGIMGFGGGVYLVPLQVCVQSFAPYTHRARMVAANNLINAVGVLLSLGLAVVLLAFSHGRLSWVFALLGGLNILVLLWYLFRLPHVLLRFVLLFSVHRNRLPELAPPEHFGFSGGFLVVLPTLLHDNYLRRMAALPLECTVVLSGRLPSSRTVCWLRRHQFVQEYTHLEEMATQGDLIRQIASHIQQNRVIAIDNPMYEVLRKRYRLDDMPLVLLKKNILMHVFVCREAISESEDNAHLVWHFIKKEIAPA